MYLDPFTTASCYSLLFSSGLDEGETHAFPLNDVRNNQTKMNFSTPFSPENKSSTVILKWSYCLLKLKKKSFL